jgi:hypothetical protein
VTHIAVLIVWSVLGPNYTHGTLFIVALNVAVSFVAMFTLIFYDVESAQWSHVLQ